MFDSQTIAALTTMADETEINPAALLAIAEVESGGKALFDISGGKEPAIRFEGHYFDRRLSGRLRDYARSNSLSAPVAGQIRNPKSQAARWLLLERAMGLSKKAALESTSWGWGRLWVRIGNGLVMPPSMNLWRKHADRLPGRRG